MNAYRIIDKNTWPRAELFDFYQGFDNTCFSVTVSLEAERLKNYAKEQGLSFFLVALYAIVRAANSVPQMRQRIVDGNIVEFEKIAVMTPIMTKQGLFRQIWCEYQPTLEAFMQETSPKVAAAKADTPAPLVRDAQQGDAPQGIANRDNVKPGEDFLCASCLPWLHFTGLTQADLYFGQAVPILAWGKLKNGCIPVACKFHHAFMDGLHVGRFFSHLEESFAHPHTL